MPPVSASVSISKWASFQLLVRRVRALSRPYFSSEDKWKARGLLAAIVALNLGAVYMLVLLNDWNRLFYDALQNKDSGAFWTQLGRFTYLALAFVVIAVYQFYLTQLLEIRWRAWMTNHYLERWLAGQTFYKLELARFTPARSGASSNGNAGSPDNPDQRIQEDVGQFTNYTMALSMGLLNAVVTLLSFIGILWSLSGNFTFTLGGQTFDIPGFMVWAAVLYSVAGSVVSHYIGRPQIRLNFEQQRREADFRNHMVRVREYSESIALDRGEPAERVQLDRHFAGVLQNFLALLKAQKNLTWFTVGFSQAAMVFPLIVAAPRFFSGAIQLGELMQISSAFGQVQGSLSWFVNNYRNLATWRAITDRLTSFEETMLSVALEKTTLTATNSIAIDSTDLTIALPTGETLLANAVLHARGGERILLNGPSGSGKSSLFRVLAGIWPFAQGHLARPADAMFIPQRPYFPNGPLRDVLAYPEPANRYADAALQQALHDALLPQLACQLDLTSAWSQKLSGGEQQRLAIARVLLKKPQWVFADEATSALDTAAETELYQRLIALVAERQGGLVSIAHRPSVAAFHTRRWVLEPQPPGAAARFTLCEKPL